MEQLTLDVGIKEYNINGTAVLRFNPADPNLYARYIASIDKIDAVEKEMQEKAQAIDENSPTFAEESFNLMAEADAKVKEVLSETFGNGNDFDKIFDGVNVMAVAVNGERVIANFMNLVGPLLDAGVTSFVDKQVEEKKLNRQQRRAMAK